ncbi:MAG: GNAT family N-acetyltransferase [Paracoccaceae bacterium]|nr:GNAT family N-acetyltransferase [Paracoccaceae bacterium]
MSPAFARLVPGDEARLAHLTMAPGQDRFTADPVTRLAGLPPDQDGWAILWEGAVAGFMVIDRGYAAAHDFARDGEPGLRSVLIDAGLQGRGIGKAAMAALPGFMARHYPAARSLCLTVNAQNLGAKAVYERAGFADTGSLYLGGRSGPQHVLRMELARAP